LYLKKEHFKTAIPVSITAMLVMVTLNNSLSKKLPQTSDIKFIDLWILFGILLHFTILILLVIIEHYPDESSIVYVEEKPVDMRRRSKIPAKESIVLFAKRLLPISVIIFIVCYFIAAFIIYTLEITDD